MEGTESTAGALGAMARARQEEALRRLGSMADDIGCGPWHSAMRILLLLPVLDLDIQAMSGALTALAGEHPSISVVTAIAEAMDAMRPNVVKLMEMLARTMDDETRHAMAALGEKILQNGGAGP